MTVCLINVGHLDREDGGRERERERQGEGRGDIRRNSQPIEKVCFHTAKLFTSA